MKYFSAAKNFLYKLFNFMKLFLDKLPIFLGQPECFFIFIDISFLELGLATN